MSLLQVAHLRLFTHVALKIIGQHESQGDYFECNSCVVIMLHLS